MTDRNITTVSAGGAEDEISVAQYVRMSTEHQRYSTENQMVVIAEYAAKHGMRIVRSYKDEGKSGLNIEGREGLRSLLDDVQQKRCVFRAKLDTRSAPNWTLIPRQTGH